MKSIGKVLAIAVGLDYTFYFMDIRTTFLNAHMEEDKGKNHYKSKGPWGTWTGVFNMKGFNLDYKPGERAEVYLYQPKEKLLDEDKRHYQLLSGTDMYLEQV